MRPFQGIDCLGRGGEPPRSEELVGVWRACGLREGLDLRTPDGRVCYYPVGRGDVTFARDGAFRLRTVNAAGTFAREGSWALAGGALLVRLGGDEGRFLPRVEGRILRLAPDRAHLRCAQKLLHAPAFEKEGRGGAPDGF